MKFDQRKEYQMMYESLKKGDQAKFYKLPKIADIMKSDQAAQFTKDVYLRELTEQIKKGQSPNRLMLKEPFILRPAAFVLRANDILYPGFVKYLSWMMDTGIVRKLYSPYYMTDGKL